MLAMTQQTINPRNAAKLIAIALSIYVIWVAATYILEGRIHLFQKSLFTRYLSHLEK
jgi:hypothetical protein